MDTPRHERVGPQPDPDHGRGRATSGPGSGPAPMASRPLTNGMLASLFGPTAATGAPVVQREGVTPATLDATVKSKGWPEVFNWLNGAPMDYILSWLLALSAKQFEAVEDNMFEMTGNRPRTAIAINAVSEARKGPASKSTLDYYESRFRILDIDTLPYDQRDWIRGVLGAGPYAGKVKPLSAAAAATAKPAAGGGGATASSGGGTASTSGFREGQISDAEVGTKFPDLADEVAKKLFGKDTFKDLVQSYKSIKVFGKTTFVLEEFGDELLKADADARPKVEAKEGRSFTDKDWQINLISGYQKNKGGGLHPWGVAVDIDYAENPYIANEFTDIQGGVNIVDKYTTPVYQRIALLMLDPPRTSLIPGGGKLTYEALDAESKAMVAYFAMRGDAAKIKAQVDARKDLLDAAQWKTVFNGDEVAEGDRATKLTALIPQDYTYLSAGPSEEAPNKLTGTADRPFDTKGGALTGRDPAKGFLTIRKEVVDALRAQPNMRWGGTDFGAGINGDIMHFDLGKKYNPKGTAAKLKADAEKAEKEKAKEQAGATPVQKMAAAGASGLPRWIIQRHEEGEEDLVEEEIINPPELQRSAIPGATIQPRPVPDAHRLWAETVTRIQRLAGNKAAEAAALRLHDDDRI